jgi:hypothetical protein
MAWLDAPPRQPGQRINLINLQPEVLLAPSPDSGNDTSRKRTIPQRRKRKSSPSEAGEDLGEGSRHSYFPPPTPCTNTGQPPKPYLPLSRGQMYHFNTRFI